MPVDILKLFKRNTAVASKNATKKKTEEKGFLATVYEVLIKKKPKRTAEDDPPPVNVISKARIITIQVLVHRITAGIGGIYPSYNGYVMSYFCFFLWAFHLTVHFGLDFYEAVNVFHPSWATSIAVFLVTLVSCSFFTVRKSVPWFAKRIKKLNNDGLYPATIKKVEVLTKLLPLAIPMCAVSAALGQFMCYYFDGALKINFNHAGSDGNAVKVPESIEILLNLLRGTSLIHVYYEFFHLLLFHLVLMVMLQGSMEEFNERMGFKLREHPVDLTFAEAVDIFSARVKFVKEASTKCMGVVTTLSLACSVSFILNAYNYLFVKQFAIYIYFAIAPLLWLVVPLMGAAWITGTYQKYKMVVVNSWVEIPEEDEDENAKSAEKQEKHGIAKIGQRLKNTIRRQSHSPEPVSEISLKPEQDEKKFSSRKRLSLQIPSSKMAAFRTSSLNSQNSLSSPDSPESSQPPSPRNHSAPGDIRTPVSSDNEENFPKTTRSVSWAPSSTSGGLPKEVLNDSWTNVEIESECAEKDLAVASNPRRDSATSESSAKGSSSTSTESVSEVSLKVPISGSSTSLRSHSESSLQTSKPRIGLPPLKLKRTKTTPLSAALEQLRLKNGDVFQFSESSENDDDKIQDTDNVIKSSYKLTANEISDSKLEKITERPTKEVPEDFQSTMTTLCESSEDDEDIEVIQTDAEKNTKQTPTKTDVAKPKEVELPIIPSVVIEMPPSDENQNNKSSPQSLEKNTLGKLRGFSLFSRGNKSDNLLYPINEKNGITSDGELSDNDELDAMNKLRPVRKVNLMRGIAKTVTKWRTKVKVKKKFHFEKYILYLENILPNIGFVVGNVVISWDMVKLLCSVLFTLVGVFAQEAFFGN